MSKLYFRVGSIEGFTSIKLADKREGFARPIRELLQNSLDASKEIGNDNCEINIYIETIEKNQIPHVKKYESVLDKAIETAKALGSYKDQQKQVVEKIKNTLTKDSIEIFMFSDNGVGMNDRRLNALLDGRSDKGEGADSSGGSYGVGHLSGYSLSSLQYLLYAGKYKDKNGSKETLFTGIPILAGHETKEAYRGSVGMIVKEVPGDEKKPVFNYPKEFPDFIKPKFSNIDTGTLVTILGLSEEWNKYAEYAIVSNYFHALAHESLTIKIHKENNIVLIDDAKVEKILKSEKSRKRVNHKNGEVLSGKAVWQAWLTVQEEGNRHIIKLDNNDDVYVYIKTGNDMVSTVALIRNDMLVARHDSMITPCMNNLRQNSDFEPFTIVIDVNQESAPTLFRLIKLAEGPYHNRLEQTILNKPNKQKLCKLLEELCNKIQEGNFLKKIDRKSFELPLFEVPNKAEAQTGKGDKAKGQTSEAKAQKKLNRPPKRKEPQKGEGEKRLKPVNINRNLDSKNAVRYKDKGDRWEVELRIMPQKVDAADDVYLSMCLGEDNDKNDVKTYLDFIKVRINGESIELPDFVEIEKDGELTKEPANKSQVRLGRMEQSGQYNVVAEVEKPISQIGTMKVALLPILGLRQRKNIKE